MGRRRLRYAGAEELLMGRAECFQQRIDERKHPLERKMQYECQGTEQERGVEGGGLDWTEPRG